MLLPVPTISSRATARTSIATTTKAIESIAFTVPPTNPSADYDHYFWDQRKRLTEVRTLRPNTGGGATTLKDVLYTYDGDDRRIGKQVDADGDGEHESVERYAYDGDDIALVFNDSGQITHRYLHGPGVDQILAEEKPSITLASAGNTVTPDIHSGVNGIGPVSNFSGGASIAADYYLIGYAGGAMQYNAAQPYTVHAPWPHNDGFYVKYNDGAAQTLAPGRGHINTGGEDQDAAETAGAGNVLRIHHTGGPIGVYLKDNEVNDNKDGNRSNPTFTLTPTNGGGTIGTVTWPLQDQQGTVRDIVTSDGAITHHIKYDSFGNVLLDANQALSNVAIANAGFETGTLNPATDWSKIEIGGGTASVVTLSPTSDPVKIEGTKALKMNLRVLNAGEAKSAQVGQTLLTTVAKNTTYALRVRIHTSSELKFTLELRAAGQKVAGREFISPGAMGASAWRDYLIEWESGSTPAQLGAALEVVLSSHNELTASLQGPEVMTDPQLSGQIWFDDVRLTKQATLTRNLYTGREWDAESGQYNYRARYYDAKTGTFLNSDPARDDADNLYRYVFNNATNLEDPSGLMINGWLHAAGAIFGGVLNSPKSRNGPLTDATGRPIMLVDSGAIVSDSYNATADAFANVQPPPNLTHFGIAGAQWGNVQTYEQQQQLIRDQLMRDFASVNRDDKAYRRDANPNAPTMGPASAATVTWGQMYDRANASQRAGMIRAAEQTIAYEQREQFYDREGYGTTMRILDRAFNPAWDGMGTLNDYTLMAGGFAAASASRLIGARREVPAQLEAGKAYETRRLAELGRAPNTSVWRPAPHDVESAAFKVIVGQARYTRTGLAEGTALDATRGGNLEVKGGRSVLNSTYQTRLQVYVSLKQNTWLTLDTTRPINPTFRAWLRRWGVDVKDRK